MANIKDKIENIRKAVFGKDVRGSLADGLDAINKETETTTSKQNHLEKTFDQLIINAGNSNAEIVDARVDKNSGTSYKNLGERFDAHSAQMAENMTEVNILSQEMYSEIFKKANKGDYVQAGQITGGITENQISDSLKSMIAGDAPLSAEVKEKSIGSNKMARNSIDVNEASFLECGKNMYNKNSRLLNKSLVGSIPSTFAIADSPKYDITDYIYVQKGFSYICHAGIKNIYLFNTAGECIAVILTNVGANEIRGFVPHETGYVRITLFKANSENWQFEKDTDTTRYEDYKRYLSKDLESNIAIKKNQITDFSVDGDNCNFLKVGKNKLQRNNFMNRKLISTKNELVDNAMYNSYMIELEPGTYTISGKTRNIFQFDSCLTGEGYMSTFSNITSDKPITFTTTVKSWIGINFFSDAVNRQLENGASASGFENYNYLMRDLNFTEEQMDKIKEEVAENIASAETIKVIKNNNRLTVFSNLNNNEIIKYEVEIEEKRNNCFNFINTYLLKNNKETLIHYQDDDIAPIRTFYTVGANHGYPCFSIAARGQTTVDVGSVWTDGVTDYVLAKIENNKCIFLYPYLENEEGVVSYINIAPIKALEHKINATNINTLDITNLTVAQFYCSVNNHTYNISIDNKELQEGSNIGNELNVTEKYNILCYKSLQEHLKENVGKELVGSNLDAIEGVVELCINYKFKNKALVLINHSLKVLKRVTLSSCGFLQSVRLQPNTLHYIPNTKEKGSWNFSQLINIDSYKDNLKYYINDCINTKYPINRYIQHRSDLDGNSIGFTAGYLLDIGDGSNEERLKNSMLWDFRSTKKTYPIGFSGGTLEAGAYKTFSMYRKYIATSELEENETNKTYIEAGDGLYIFIDIHKNVICSNLEIPKKFMDRKIDILEQNEGFELVNNSADVRGINYNIKNSYGYAVLKIN